MVSSRDWSVTIVDGGWGGKRVVCMLVVVLMVVRWAERNFGVVEVELTRWTNDRIIFEERPLVVIAINGLTTDCGGGGGS